MEAPDVIDPLVRRAIAGTLMDMAGSARGIVGRTFKTPPQPGSWSADLLGGFTVGETPYVAVSHSLAAGVEHVYALAKLLRLDAKLGPSIAILVRGSVEAFGRAWWLLSSADADAFTLRGTALLNQELTNAGKHGVRTMKWLPDGSSESVDDPFAEARDAYPGTPSNSNLPKVPSYTRLAVDVMESAGCESGTTTYSHLSGTAHGEGTTVLSFGRLAEGPLPGGDSRFTFALPLADARRYTYIVSNVLDTVVGKLVSDWGNTGESENWMTVRQRAFDAFNTLLPPAS